MNKYLQLFLVAGLATMLSACSTIDNYRDGDYDDGYSDEYSDEASEEFVEEVATKSSSLQPIEESVVYVEPEVVSEALVEPAQYNTSVANIEAAQYSESQPEVVLEPVQYAQPASNEQQVLYVAQPGAAQNLEILRALSQLAEIKEELKQLRNSVEIIQFETENAKRRQQDLFQDLDRRMVSVERNQSVLNPQPVQSLTEFDLVTEVVPAQTSAANATAATIPGDVAVNGQTTNSTLITSVANNSAAVQQPAASADTAVDANSTDIVSPAAVAAVSLEEQEAYDGAFEMLKQSRYEDAILQFQQMADTWPQSQLADDAYYWMSEARYVNREFEYALSGFRTIVSRYPDSQRVPEALLKVGYIQYDIGAYEDAAETFRDILARFPGHQVTISAQTRLRRIENTIQ